MLLMGILVSEGRNVGVAGPERQILAPLSIREVEELMAEEGFYSDIEIGLEVSFGVRCGFSRPCHSRCQPDSQYAVKLPVNVNLGPEFLSCFLCRRQWREQNQNTRSVYSA